MNEEFLKILDELRQRLLDLTSRNKLLNYRFPKATSLKFQLDDLESIYKKLVDEQTKLRIDGVPPPDMRPLPEVGAYASSSRWRPSGDLPVVMYEDTLMAVSRKIERDANSSISETGTNTLFLILGFLEYQESANSQVSLQAPLVSVPVTIEKKLYHGQQKYYLVSNGEEVEENLSLREKMKRDFNIIMPVFDDESFSMSDYLSKIERAIQRHPTFKINRTAALGFLSFKGMLMIKDLDHQQWSTGRNGNTLLDHPIMKKLFGEMDSSEPSTVLFGESEEYYNVDSKENSKLPLVYDADHSQHSALIDVLNKEKHLVIQGPPGTGKSQTITNIIAGALEKGLSVLFVAEKLAALEVVKHRLDSVGLEPLLLELHSDKANKKTVLESLNRRIQYNFTDFHTLDGDMSSLQKSIDDLNSYSAMMSETLQNSLNLTVHSTLWRWIRLRESGLDESVLNSLFHISDAETLTVEVLDERVDFLVEIKQALDALGSNPVNHPFDGFEPNTPTPIFVEELKKTQKDFIARATSFKKSLTTYESFWSGKYGPAITSLPEDVEILKKWITATEAFGRESLVNGISSAKHSGGHFNHLNDSLKELESAIQEYERLKSAYSSTVKLPDDVQSADESGIQSVLSVMSDAGVSASIQELSGLIEKVQSVANDTLTTLAALSKVLSQYGQEFDGSRSHLRHWISLGICISKAPIDDFHHQSDRLFRTGSVLGIQELKTLKESMYELREELDSILYFDQLPEQSELNNAIRTLRAGTEWYRVFNSDYRSAIHMHKSLDRLNRSLDGIARLKEMERLAICLEKRREWTQHQAWQEVLGVSPSLDVDLDKILSLAQWNSGLAAVLRIRIEEVDRAWLNQVVEMVRDARINEVNELLERLENRSMDMLSLLPNVGNDISSTSLTDVAGRYLEVAEKISIIFPLIERQSHGIGSLTTLHQSIVQVLDARKLKFSLEGRTDFAWTAGLYRGIDTDTSLIREAIELVTQMAKSELKTELKEIILTKEPVVLARSVIQTLEKVIQFRELIVEFQMRMSSLGKFSYKKWFRLSIEAKPVDVFTKLIEKGEGVLGSIDSIYTWYHYWNLRSKASDYKVSRFVDAMEKDEIQADRITDVYKLAVYNSLLSDFMTTNRGFSSWTGEKLNQLKHLLRTRDKQIISRRGHAIAKKCSKLGLTDPGNDGSRVDDKTEVYLINHLIGQSRPRVPLRKLLSKAPKTILALKPCFMMSPQSVVRFLEPNKIKFDLLVMDEASQLKPEEAISAIARAKQIVVVGDSKQLPPTTFFQSNQDNQVDEDDGGSVVTDVESILEIASRAFGHSRSLKVHYRSRHQSLVAFSNHNFYDNKLLLFPSPFEPNKRFGVRALYMANAYFDGGLNPVEAGKVVDLIADHVNNRRTESLGVVAVNLKQSDLIAELLDQRLHDDPQLSARMEELPERLFIKNLENVQGDERDVIIISTTYGRKPNTSVVQQRFGPIGFENGWRRLNVLFTRARNSMILVTSLRPSDIKVDDDSKLGVKTFRKYLEYVFNGCILPENTMVHEPESEFEESVIRILTANGYDAVPQLGVAGYRIDIAVKHPHYEGMYLAAIECDGATYHSSKSARERDRIRQEILEQLGWQGKIWRIWSTDWFIRREEEKRKLLQFLEDRKMELQEIYEKVQHWEVIGNEQVLQIMNHAQNGVEVVTEALQINGIDETLLGDDTDEIVVKVGDSFTYLDLEHPDLVKTATIVRGPSVEEKNQISYKKPFAEAFLGCAEGAIAELKLSDRIKKYKLIKIE